MEVGPLYKTVFTIWHPADATDHDIGEIAASIQDMTNELGMAYTCPPTELVEKPADDPDWVSEIAEELGLEPCKFCHKLISEEGAHLHDHELVCPTCWDERLRSSE